MSLKKTPWIFSTKRTAECIGLASLRKALFIKKNNPFLLYCRIPSSHSFLSCPLYKHSHGITTLKIMKCFIEVTMIISLGQIAVGGNWVSGWDTSTSRAGRTLAPGAASGVALCSQAACWKDWEHKKKTGLLSIAWHKGRECSSSRCCWLYQWATEVSEETGKLHPQVSPCRWPACRWSITFVQGQMATGHQKDSADLRPPPLLCVTDWQGFNVPSEILWTLPLPINSTDGKHLLPAYIALGQKPEVQNELKQLNGFAE